MQARKRTGWDKSGAGRRMTAGLWLPACSMTRYGTNSRTRVAKLLSVNTAAVATRSFVQGDSKSCLMMNFVTAFAILILLLANGAGLDVEFSYVVITLAP